MNKVASAPVGIIGANGYTGRELLRILRGHASMEAVFATSEAAAGAASVQDGLRLVRAGDAELGAAEVLFLSVPHGEATPWARAGRDAGVRVIDLSHDHRPGSGRENGAVYGLTELFREEIEDAGLVANPGCYPTGAILALWPLVEGGAVDRARPVIVNAASGVTGAGRSPRTELLFAEVSGDFRAYAAGNVHRHLDELRAVLPGVSLVFTPHLLPVPRGILETIYLPLQPGVGAGGVRELWREAYAGSAVVRVLEEGLPAVGDVADGDGAALGVVVNADTDPPLATAVAALDNLGKGAAGQAVQNANVMLGFAEREGLRC